MRGINFLAGLGTILVFAGIYCLKAAFHKQITKEGTNTAPVKNYERALFILTGIVFLAGGVLLILQAVKKTL